MGAIYALLALGLVMIIRAVNMPNIAQCEMAMIGAFISYNLYAVLAIPFYLTFIITILITGLVGVLIERFAYRPAMKGKAPIANAIIASVAVHILLTNLARIIGSPRPLRFPSPLGERLISLGMAKIPMQSILIIGAGLFIMALLQFFFKTRIGLALRAVMSDREVAQLMGIKVSWAISWTFAISAALGAAGGILVAPVVFVVFNMGSMLLGKALAAAAVGGFYSIPGAVVGGFTVGILRTVFSNISSAYADSFVYAILIAILLLMPESYISKLIGTRRG